jgi:hypothetical protein
MKLSLILITLAVLTTPVLAAKPLAMRIESRCETCTPTNRDKLDAALRNNLQEFGIVEADPVSKAPTLILFALEADSSWFLSQVVNSPRGTLVSVSRAEFKGGFKEILEWGADSAVVDSKRIIEAAIQRAKEAANATPAPSKPAEKKAK